MRNKSGQVALSLNLVIAIFVVGSLGLVAYEISRILLAREQLKHCLEFAALGGSAAIASSSQTGDNARSLGQNAAVNIMAMNSILGQPLSTRLTQVSSLSSISPAPGTAQIYIEYDDPITKQPAPATQEVGVMRVYGAYAYELFSGGFGAIGVNVYTVMADATAGLPSMDIVIVYNNDDSNDDQTPITTVRRYWDPGPPAIAYFTPNPGGSDPQSGTITSVVCPPDIGTSVNGLPPQNLETAGDSRVNSCPKEFSEIGPDGKTVPLRGTANTGVAPGDAPPSWGGVGVASMWTGSGYAQPAVLADNFDELKQHFSSVFWSRLIADASSVHFEQPAEATFLGNAPDLGSASYNPWKADPTMFTDVVVNLDGNNVFGGYAPTGAFSSYQFPTIDFLVEAARGNMDNGGISPNTHTTNPVGSASQPGYQAAYTALAMRQLQPKATFESAINTFTTKLMQTADCHLGLVTYNDITGVGGVSGTITQPMVSYAYPVAGNITVQVPEVELNQTANNYTTITNILTPPAAPITSYFTPSGGSNLAAGLMEANNMLNGPGARAGAFKAIVVVTDKTPDRDLKGNQYTSPTMNGGALADTLTQAQNDYTQGVPIFIVSLAQNADEAAAMQNEFSDTISGGVVSTAGHGGTLSVDTWTNAASSYTTLVGRFNNVVRQLCTLVSG